MSKLPDFETLDEAVEFWESHDSADYEMETVAFQVDLLQNLFHPRLVTLAYQPERCPRCQQAFDAVEIEYVVRHSGRLVVIRDVPVLRCRVNRHTYILEKTLDVVERLLDLKPGETIQVPVFSLKIAAAAM